jgi:hypothetical protein
MKMKQFAGRLTAVLAVALLVPVGAAFADGSETGLGAPSLTLAVGTHLVAGGTGMFTQPSNVSVPVPPGATIKQVLLYWEGMYRPNNVGDDTILVNGAPVVGTNIGGPTLFFSNVFVASYRADITGLSVVTDGSLNIITLSGMDFSEANDGAGVMVIYDDGSDEKLIVIRDGLDLLFSERDAPLDTAVAQTFTFDAAAGDRTAELNMFFGSVKNASRPNAIAITVDGDTTTVVNPLSSGDGQEWDTFTYPVLIPAGATELTIEPLSVGDGTSNVPASLSWVNVAVCLPLEPECTGVIGDFIWNDLNGNGLQDDGEPGISDVLVYLEDEQGVIDMTTTDSQGHYEFTGLCAGRYFVCPDNTSVPEGFVPCPTEVGDDDTIDSNPNCAEVVLDENDSSDLTIDFCYMAPPTECAPCDGKFNELTLQYLGDVDDTNIVVWDKQRGRPGDVIFNDTVQPDGTFALIGHDKHGTLGTEIYISINGGGLLQIHTSCSDPNVVPGYIIGDIKVVAASSRNGGPICEGDPGDPGDPGEDPECGTCDGKVDELMLKYIGDIDDAEIVVRAKERGRPGRTLFEGTVQPGGIFSLSGWDRQSTLGTDIYLSINGGENLRIHTSCSVPIGPGSVFGDFEVVAGSSRNGGALTPVDDNADCDEAEIQPVTTTTSTSGFFGRGRGRGRIKDDGYAPASMYEEEVVEEDDEEKPAPRRRRLGWFR